MRLDYGPVLAFQHSSLQIIVKLFYTFFAIYLWGVWQKRKWNMEQRRRAQGIKHDKTLPSLPSIHPSLFFLSTFLKWFTEHYCNQGRSVVSNPTVCVCMCVCMCDCVYVWVCAWCTNRAMNKLYWLTSIARLEETCQVWFLTGITLALSQLIVFYPIDSRHVDLVVLWWTVLGYVPQWILFQKMQPISGICFPPNDMFMWGFT